MKRPFPDSDAVMLKTDMLLKNDNGNVSVMSHDVLTKNIIAEYSKNSGVVYENPSSIFDFENLAEKLKKQSEEIHNNFYNAIDIDSTYEKSIDLSNDNMNFKNVFHKFRGCLDEFRVAFADEIGKVPSLTVGSTTYEVAYLKESTPATLTYVNMKNNVDVKTMVEMLESMKNKVLDILKDPAAASTATTSTSTSSTASSSTATSSSTTTAASPATAASSTTTASPATSTAAAPPPPNFSSLKYDVTLTTIDKDKDNFKIWSAKEVGILEEPQNHENVLYVIGQVFNIIPPDYYESFLTDNPSTSSSASSLSSVSKTNFFQFIVKDPASNIMSISKDGTLYVGETNGNQKNGKGMMRWANGNIFEGEFVNDSIKTNVDGIFNGKPLKITDANTGAATLDGAAGIFDMNTGEFKPNTVVAISSAGP
jgi:hypothetical protein